MYLDDTSELRLPESLKDRINCIVDRDSYLFENESHFIRVAIIKLLKERERLTIQARQREKKLITHANTEDG